VAAGVDELPFDFGFDGALGPLRCGRGLSPESSRNQNSGEISNATTHVNVPRRLAGSSNATKAEKQKPGRELNRGRA
jgi:hypothetical protein